MTEPSIFAGLDLDFDTRFTAIKAIASILPVDPGEELAKLVVFNAAYQTMNRELELLAIEMGIDLSDTPAEKLAEVIELFDGNRRKYR